jgi:hypothetical protein
VKNLLPTVTSIRLPVFTAETVGRSAFAIIPQLHRSNAIKIVFFILFAVELFRISQKYQKGQSRFPRYCPF